MGEPVLYLDRVLYPVTALGPGRRVALWVAGCSRHCPGCANPELWERRPEQRIPVARLCRVLERLFREKRPDGLTITGGEPLEQSEGLCALLEGLTSLPEDVLLYSGFQREELEGRPKAKRLLRRVSVLIDGAYVEEKNRPDIVLRGSCNQRIWFLRPEAEKRYEDYLRLGRQVQNFVYDQTILSVGIHNRTDAGAGQGKE